jgi:hypothetical protein
MQFAGFEEQEYLSRYKEIPSVLLLSCSYFNPSKLTQGQWSPVTYFSGGAYLRLNLKLLTLKSQEIKEKYLVMLQLLTKD